MMLQFQSGGPASTVHGPREENGPLKAETASPRLRGPLLLALWGRT